MAFILTETSTFFLKVTVTVQFEYKFYFKVIMMGFADPHLTGFHFPAKLMIVFFLDEVQVDISSSDHFLSRPVFLADLHVDVAHQRDL